MENKDKINICSNCGIELAYENYVGWWCPNCDTVPTSNSLSGVKT